MAKVLPADCDHPEESLLPLPYQGRPPRADEWECGVCGTWNISKEAAYKRRTVEDWSSDHLSQTPLAVVGVHAFECAERKSLEPMHVGPPRRDSCKCPCHDTFPYHGDMWRWRPAVPRDPLRGVGYLTNPSPYAITAVNALLAQGKVRSIDVSMDVPTGLFSIFQHPPGLAVTAVGVAADAAVEVMKAMYDLVMNRGAHLVWDMSREMLYELQQRASPPSLFPGKPQGGPPTPTLLGGEIRVHNGAPPRDITMRVR